MIKKTHAIYILKDIFIFFIILTFALVIIILPQISYNGVINGLKISVETLIPSLFPFMILSSFIVYLNLNYKIFEKITKFIFNLPSSSTIAIILGLIGGYPMGAKLIKDLFNQKLITEKQAERMILFCFNSGPAFTLNIVGYNIFKSRKIGIAIFLSQTLASLIIGIVLGWRSKLYKTKIEEKIQSKSEKNKNLSYALIKSCETSSIVMINLCALVVIFNVINSFIKYFTPCINKNLTTSIFSILEVTQGILESSKNNLGIEHYSIILGWGGLCVHMQVKSIFGKLKFSYLKFIIFRLINIALSFIFLCLLIKIFKINDKTYFVKEIFMPKLSSNICGSTVLIFSCLYFLMSLN
ncbi:MAG: sporulation integral membrane protein YlbJ [Candidatus Improbicoccus pseudotrichonymphae]|uniref:Sporulation integral membrane protein YlbJ n=1 Tax=Candidatus Improbicoccus pseudotrichonymphae TaxID=3033792 RepID=A0AA48HY28_9FIRM|nr:MAG: sporulation integral membrane protein YlbJ [Candidatus Improbicoccus pseudotrichonymphae]